MKEKTAAEIAAEQYCNENKGTAFEYQAFLQGAEFAAKQAQEKAKEDKPTKKNDR